MKHDPNAITLPSFPAFSESSFEEEHDTDPDMQSVVSERFRTKTDPFLTMADHREIQDRLLAREVVESSKRRHSDAGHYMQIPVWGDVRKAPPPIKREEED